MPEESPDINQSEQKLAPYAARPELSKGRIHPIHPNPYRSPFQRDRDRIIHSTAFRRLQHKTQVFANIGSKSDHYRTRLTHTIEVAQITRTIARALGLNDDLAEAVALAHDLGHTPFGHAGEEVLEELLSEQGGFNHNFQSLRVVDYLEKRYPDHFGLNLTFETRESIIKHETHGDHAIPEEFIPDEFPPLEGQIVDLADEIAYNGHDVDDGLASGFLTLAQLRKTEFLGPLIKDIEREEELVIERMIRFALVRKIVDMLVVDLITNIATTIKVENITSYEDVRHAAKRLAGFSDRTMRFNSELKSFLLENMYSNPKLSEMKERSFIIMTFLFKYYLKNIDAIPAEFRKRYPGQSDRRLATDYIAGMTDRFAEGEYERLTK